MLLIPGQKARSQQYGRSYWKCGEIRCCISPFTLHPTPHILNPAPYTLHPKPYTLNPTPSPRTAGSTGAVCGKLRGTSMLRPPGALRRISTPHTLITQLASYTLNPAPYPRTKGSSAPEQCVGHCGELRRCDRPEHSSQPHPQSHTYIMHLTPHTPHPTPHTLARTPYTLHPIPYALHPTP